MERPADEAPYLAQMVHFSAESSTIMGRVIAGTGPGNCATCGEALEGYSGKGRPRQYCSTDCRRIEEYLGRLEHPLAAGKFSRARASALRSRLWAMANLLNDRLTEDKQ